MTHNPTSTLPAALAMFNLTGRVALITGSGSGIGLALAEGLRSAGARVVLNGRNRDKLQSAAHQLSALPGPSIAPWAKNKRRCRRVVWSGGVLVCIG